MALKIIKTRKLTIKTLKNSFLTKYWIRKNKRNLYKKKRIHFRQKLVLSKRNLGNKRYYLFYKRKKNNIFLTITNIKGEVLSSYSAGICKITTKKKKRSPDTLKTVSSALAKKIKEKGIKYIFKFFMSTKNSKIGKIVFKNFEKSGLSILQAVVIKSKPHASLMRKKKQKRL